MEVSSRQMRIVDSAPILDLRGPSAAPVLLIAEDNPINAELLAMTAGRLGLAVEFACDGEVAIAMIERARREGRPMSLVLMDIMMPVMDGVQAARRLRDLGFSAEELPIIAVTAAASSSEARTYLSAGMQACVCKPILLEELSGVIATWLPHAVRTQNDVNEQPVSSLKQRYQTRKADTMRRIEAALAEEDLRPETLAKIRHLLHKLAGTAGSFGEASLGDTAMRCEIALVDAKPDHLYTTLVDSRDRLLRAR